MRCQPGSHLKQQESGRIGFHCLPVENAPSLLSRVTSEKKLSTDIQSEMVRKIAEGGMGLVYEAEQLGAGNFRKVVAAKVIRGEYSAIGEFQKNFISEARLVADLIHTNIVQTYHLGQVSRHYFMVMEFMRGANLEQFLDRHRALRRTIPVDLAAYLISRIARGLTCAQERSGCDERQLNIVYRHIGPKSIMVAYEGDVKLTDFGIAKALDLMHQAESEAIAGKDEYLSPEQASYAVTDARADLFPLGIVLTELLLGKTSFVPRIAPHPVATSSRCRSRSFPLGGPTSIPNFRPLFKRPCSATAASASKLRRK